MFNLTTDKLNVFTGGKAEWLTLSEADRKSISSLCLFSRLQGCWVSRGKNGSWNVQSLKATVKSLGFEDRGTEGEKLSFAEQVENQQEHASERAERFEARAEKAEKQATALYEQAHKMADEIPFGQPILAGHHSEKRDRNYRDRIHNKFGKAFEENDKAKHYAAKAEIASTTAEGTQYSNPGYLGRRIHELEAKVRKYPNYSEYQEKLDFFKTKLAACVENGTKVYNKETLKQYKEVFLHSTWYPIVRLNPTTVAVPNICFPTEELQRKYAFKYLYTEVKDAR